MFFRFQRVAFQHVQLGSLIKAQQNFFSTRQRVSLFKAHQDRQIQDRVTEERQILLSNDQRKVNPQSKEITPTEIANFDIYYGRFNSVISQGTGRDRKLVKSLQKFDVELVLKNKLGTDQSKIIDFAKQRGSSKMKAAEIIYILEYFARNKNEFQSILDTDPNFINETLYDCLSKINIYSSKELVKLLKLCKLFEIKDQQVYKNLLKKGNLLLCDNHELDECSNDITLILSIFMEVEFNDLSSQSLLLQLKKKLLRQLYQLDIDQAISLFILLTSRGVFLDPQQIQQFEDRFVANQENLSMDQLINIFNSFAKIPYHSSFLSQYFIQYRLSKLTSIVLTYLPQIKANKSNFNLINSSSDNPSLLIVQQQESQDTQGTEAINTANTISLNSFITMLKAFSHIPQLSSEQMSGVWNEFEQLLVTFFEKSIKVGQMDKVFNSQQLESLIDSFETSKRGSSKIWQLLSNRSEIELKYKDNYIILKNLCKNNIQSISQLNLSLSYILDEKTDKPKFEELLSRESAHSILEKIEVYAVVIYKYIEIKQQTLQQLNDKSTNNSELLFQQENMKSLLTAAMNSLLKGKDRKWKELSSLEALKLYGLLLLCNYKSSNNSSECDLTLIERSLQKERSEYSTKEVLFISLITEAFATESQLMKWQGFISQCINRASQIELANYFSGFYRHGLIDPYIWSLLLLKFVHHIELFSLKELLSFTLGFMKKQDIDSEIWELILELIKIKAVDTDHLKFLTIFKQTLQTQSTLSTDKQKRLLEIDDIIKSLNNCKQDPQMEEFNYLESLGLSLEDIIEEKQTINVYKAGNIQHILNLLN